MSYCTLDDIKGQLPEEQIIRLTDDNSLGVIGEEHVNLAIANADVIIDGHCAGRYLLPFTTVPAILKPLAVDLAIYQLYARRVETMPELRDKNRNNAVKMLEQIGKGVIRLGDAAGVEATPPTSGGVQIAAATPVFTDSSLENF